MAHQNGTAPPHSLNNQLVAIPADPELSYDPPEVLFRRKAVNRSKCYQIAYYLSQVLPAELVPDILLHAGELDVQWTEWKHWWPVSTDPQTTPVTIWQSRGLRTCIRRLNPVMKIVFEIKAKDFLHPEHPYRPACTGFTAGIIRKTDNRQDYLEKCYEQEDFRPAEDERRCLYKANVLQHERVILRNPRPVTNLDWEDWKTYIIVWRADSDDEGERRFVESVRMGDSVAVRPWVDSDAQWKNIVKSVAVTMISPMVVRL